MNARDQHGDEVVALTAQGIGEEREGVGWRFVRVEVIWLCSHAWMIADDGREVRKPAHSGGEVGAGFHAWRVDLLFRGVAGRAIIAEEVKKDKHGRRVSCGES